MKEKKCSTGLKCLERNSILKNIEILKLGIEQRLR